MERETEPAEEQVTVETQIENNETSRGIEVAGKSPASTRKAEQENIMLLAFEAMKRMDEKKNPHKVRSKKKRRAAAKTARRSRKQS